MSKTEFTSIVKLYQFIFNDGSQLNPTFYNLSNIKWFPEELLVIFFIFFILADRMEFGFYVEGTKHVVNGVSA